jgi:lipopolysaccharide exporter
MSSVRRSMAISIAERYATIALTLVSFVVVARLLTPTDIGLFSIASALVGLAQVVRDFGVGSYLVQETELTPQRVNTAFTLTAAAGALLFATLFVASPWIAAFYNDMRLVDVLRVLSINFLLIPVGSTSLALLRREMRFGGIFMVNMSATAVSFTVTMALAFTGHAYMSLVWSSVVGTAFTAGVAWYLRPNDAPLRLGLRDWRRIVTYGSQMTAAGIITEIAMSVNDLVIGRVMGPAAVAIASRAQGVMNIMHRDLLGAVAGVMFAAFARTRREGGDLAASYHRSVALISVVAWPFYGFLALFPGESLRLLFGPQWDAAAPLVPIFCMAGAVAVLWRLVPALLQAAGRADLVMQAELTIQPARLVLLTTVILAFRSLEAFAYALLAVYLGSVLVFSGGRQKVLGEASSLWSTPLVKSLCVTAAALAPAAMLATARQAGWTNGHPPLGFWVAVGATCLCWLIALHAVRHPLADDPIFLKARRALRPGAA